MAKKEPAAQQQAEGTETEKEAAEETKEEGSRCWICEKTECLCPEVVRSYASKEEYRAKVTATAADDTQGSGEHSLVWSLPPLAGSGRAQIGFKFEAYRHRRGAVGAGWGSNLTPLAPG